MNAFVLGKNSVKGDKSSVSVAPWVDISVNEEKTECGMGHMKGTLFREQGKQMEGLPQSVGWGLVM